MVGCGCTLFYVGRPASTGELESPVPGSPSEPSDTLFFIATFANDMTSAQISYESHNGVHLNRPQDRPH